MARLIDDIHLSALAAAWATHRLAVASERVPTWDALVLTASSPAQAGLYRRQIESARRAGAIAARTLVLVVPDPQGRRIGSGGATLGALRAVARALDGIDRRRVLLIHAGGDSKRLPWANILGKPFVPFPLLADADRPVPTLFDHLMAVAAPVVENLPAGGALILTGDVLPLFDAGALRPLADAATVVVTPAPLDVAGRHGVAVIDGRATTIGGPVRDLLQKATPQALIAAGALVGSGAALLDTGIYALAGTAWRALINLADADPDPLVDLLADGRECSLYEEVASAFVPARHGWLAVRPLGRRLIAALGAHRLHAAQVDRLAFVHLGTSSEFLDHLARPWNGAMARRILAEAPGADDRAFVYDSRVGDAVIGSGSAVIASRLGAGSRIGARCVVLGVQTDGPLRMPDHCCAWQVPVMADEVADAAAPMAQAGSAILCCGVDDNPKEPWGTATIANHSASAWAAARDIDPADLWSPGDERCLWTARIHPVADATGGWVEWLTGVDPDRAMTPRWRAARRVSMAALHDRADQGAYAKRHDDLVADLAERAVAQTLDGGRDRDIGSLLRRIPLARIAGSARPGLAAQVAAHVPESRRQRMIADLARARGEDDRADTATAAAFAAVDGEVAAALRQRAIDPIAGDPMQASGPVVVRLPARFDLAGGWSDTPPWCLERPARVLNLAIALHGELPIAAQVEWLPEPRWDLHLDDQGRSTTVRPAEVGTPSRLDDPFALLRTGLEVAGYGIAGRIIRGARVRTRSAVPRGSGLGASSILAAALMTALQRLAGRPSDPATVVDLVLLVEQRMTTGGGWQDQIGGLVPGMKCISSVPTRPLRIAIDPVPLLPAVVDQLQRRLVLAFTGQERLARNVLQIVVGRYLARDQRVCDAIARLVELADECRRAGALGDLDDLGAVMAEAWRLHQVLDPSCSNPGVDRIMRAVGDWSCGAKLSGAGGGGFLGVMAKDETAATRIKAALSAIGGGVQVYEWTLA